MSVLADLGSSFLLGLLMPLTALCILPLFPGFIAYLSNCLGRKKDRKYLAISGVIVSAGVLVFMLLFGIIFTTILQASLTRVIGMISPVAFGILAVIGALLMFNVDFSNYLPHVKVPVRKSPLVGAFIFGFFFGAIAIPCNPAFIAVMFTKSLLITSPVTNILSFLLFVVGMTAPLLLFSLISLAANRLIISFLIRYKREINIIAGTILLVISIYYLAFLFRILGG